MSDYHTTKPTATPEGYEEWLDEIEQRWGLEILADAETNQRARDLNNEHRTIKQELERIVEDGSSPVSSKTHNIGRAYAYLTGAAEVMLDNPRCATPDQIAEWLEAARWMRRTA